MAQPTALEQYLLERVNIERARVGVQPLASNTALDQAAEGHSQWMIDTDTFSHTGAGGSNPGARMMAASYVFGGSSWANGENIAWASTRAPNGYQDEVDLLHANLMNSPGHRANLLNGDFKEVGLGFKVGEFQGWQGAFVTEDFARSGTGSFLTGVAYTDKNGNHAYDPGEGLRGLTVDAVNATGAHFTTITMDAGGYNLKLAPGSYSIAFKSGSGATSPQSVTISALNAKMDAVNPGFAAVSTTLSAHPADQVAQTAHGVSDTLDFSWLQGQDDSHAQVDVAKTRGAGSVGADTSALSTSDHYQVDLAGLLNNEATHHFDQAFHNLHHWDWTLY
jgi:serralysin